MKIFISGVAGFLGSHLADAFLADGHQVVGWTNGNWVSECLEVCVCNGKVTV